MLAYHRASSVQAQSQVRQHVGTHLVLKIRVVVPLRPCADGVDEQPAHGGALLERHLRTQGSLELVL